MVLLNFELLIIKYAYVAFLNIFFQIYTNIFVQNISILYFVITIPMSNLYYFLDYQLCYYNIYIAGKCRYVNRMKAVDESQTLCW